MYSVLMKRGGVWELCYTLDNGEKVTPCLYPTLSEANAECDEFSKEFPDKEYAVGG